VVALYHSGLELRRLGGGIYYLDEKSRNHGVKDIYYHGTNCMRLNAR